MGDEEERRVGLGGSSAGREGTLLKMLALEMRVMAGLGVEGTSAV